MGGLIVKLLSFARAVRNGANISDVKTDRGGGDNMTPEHFASIGDDSFPLLTDYALLVPVANGSRAALVGYLDPKNTPKALSGEKRTYARDASTGAVVVDLWLRNDGTAILENVNGKATLAPDGSTTIESPNGTFTVAADGTITGINGGGSFQLQTSGDFVVNGAKITSTGDFVDSAGKTLRTHTHAQGSDSDGDTQQNTGIPV